MIWYENFIKTKQNNHKILYNFCKMYGKQVTWLRVKESEDINDRKYSLVDAPTVFRNSQYDQFTHYIIIPLVELYKSDAFAPAEISDVVVPISKDFDPSIGDKVKWFSLGRDFEYIVKSAPNAVENQFYTVELSLVRSASPKEAKVMNLGEFYGKRARN